MHASFPVRLSRKPFSLSARLELSKPEDLTTTLAGISPLALDFTGISSARFTASKSL
jgi:hypothetical protein